MKKLLFILLCFTFTSCAESKKFVIDNKEVEIHPYGWFDLEAKHDSIQYKVCAANVFWSVIFSETLIVPIVLTGDQLWEPKAKKNQ